MSVLGVYNIASTVLWGLVGAGPLCGSKTGHRSLGVVSVLGLGRSSGWDRLDVRLVILRVARVDTRPGGRLDGRRSW